MRDLSLARSRFLFARGQMRFDKDFGQKFAIAMRRFALRCVLTGCFFIADSGPVMRSASATG